MRTSLQLIVTTPTGIILDAPDVHWVQVRLADGGGIGIWPWHAPLLAEVVSAPLTYADEAGLHSVQLGAGILWVNAGSLVSIYTGGLAEPSDGLDREPDPGSRPQGVAGGLPGPGTGAGHVQKG